MESPYLTGVQAAAYARISKRDLYAAIKRKRNPLPAQQRGSRYYIHVNDLEAWLREEYEVPHVLG